MTPDPLRDALLTPAHFVCLYGTTPPRADAPEERIARAASRLAGRLKGVSLDGIVVYDVQDESGRTSEPRPFPFLPTLPPVPYARRLEEATGGVPTISYKCIAGTSEPGWKAWLDETDDVRHLSLVGRASSKAACAEDATDNPVSLPRAIEIAAQHPRGLTIGGVVIPERHDPTRPGRSESERLLTKATMGCSFFVSQAVYSPEATLALLRDYAADCRGQNVKPSRIILTFTPCGRPETLTFLRWLGVRVPLEVAQRLEAAPDMLETSLHICEENLRRILESGVADGVPLGINVESVSIKKEEIEASVALVSRLQEIAGRT